VARRDIERVYEALFLNVVASFEAFVEELFIGLLVDQHGLASSYPDVRPRAIVRSHQVARALVLGGKRRYVNWLPYSETEEHAKIFFTGGRPFTSLPAQFRQELELCCVIRNAIAHRSRHANDVFVRTIVSAMTLAPRERTPAGYLRSTYIGYNPQVRYEYHTAVVLRTAAFLAA